MLHAGNAMRLITVSAKLRANLVRCDLFILRSSLGELRLTFDARAALGYIRNADWQVSVDGNLPKQRLHSTQLRNRSIGKRAQIILNCWEIRHHIRISHGYYGGLRSRMLEQLAEQAPGRIRDSG